MSCARCRHAKGRSAVFALALLLAGPLRGVARGDRQEWHLSPVGIVGAASVEKAGRTAWSFAGGAGLRAAYGFANFFELGLQTHFTASPGVRFSGITIGGQPGNLVGDLYAVELALDARLIAGVAVSRAFARFHPFFGARGGGLVRIFTSQLLLDDQRQLLFRLDDYAAILPTVTGYAGAEYRFARSWLVSLLGSFTYATGDYYSALASVEISWMTYDGAVR